LESLESCTGADRTDVYVGLDYPPSEKYVEGWRKIDDYLKEKEQNNGFNKLYVIRRNHNCGVFGSGSNYSLLYDMAMEASDKLIATEDDNEFAPLFLYFINKSLEIYEDNPLVMSICGYSQPAYNKLSVKANQIFVHDSCAWGYGMWKKKEQLTDTFDINWCEDVLRSPSKAFLLLRRFPMLVSMMINMLRSNIVYGDTRRTCANIINDTYQVRPKISLVRNWGNDGSGINCQKIIDTASEILDGRKDFEMSECDVERTKELDGAVFGILLPKHFPLKQMKIVKIWLKYLSYRIFR